MPDSRKLKMLVFIALNGALQHGMACWRAIENGASAIIYDAGMDNPAQPAFPYLRSPLQPAQQLGELAARFMPILRARSI